MHVVRFPRAADVRTRYLFFNFCEWLAANKLGQSRDDAKAVCNSSKAVGTLLSNIPVLYEGNPAEDENAEGVIEFEGLKYFKTDRKYAGQPVYESVVNLEMSIWEGIRRGQDYLTWVDPSLSEIPVSHVKPEDRDRCKAIVKVIREWNPQIAARSLAKFRALVSEASAECVNYRLKAKGGQNGGATLLHSFTRVPLGTTEEGQKEAVKMAKMLLERGANVNKVDCFGFTPLHTAMKYGWTTTLAKFLYANGADLTVRSFGQ